MVGAANVAEAKAAMAAREWKRMIDQTCRERTKKRGEALMIASPHMEVKIIHLTYVGSEDPREAFDLRS
jgi:hypothetical protein